MADRSEKHPSSIKHLTDKAKKAMEEAQKEGKRPQDAKRRYSEKFSEGLAEWIAGTISGDERIHRCRFGEYHIRVAGGKKALDVAGLDENDYLALDISIKTFNFTDKKTKNYKKNYTGRFYELLGESLDLRQAYPYALLGALIFLPEAGCFDSTKSSASSFGFAIQRFSKLLKQPGAAVELPLFDFSFIGVHNSAGDVYFFDASESPPRQGEPDFADRQSIEQINEKMLNEVEKRSDIRHSSSPNLNYDFRWSDRD